MRKRDVAKHILSVTVLVASLMIGVIQPALAAPTKLNLNPQSVTLIEGDSQEIDVSLPEPIIADDPGWVFIDISQNNASRLNLSAGDLYYEDPSSWTQHKKFTISALDDMKVNGNTVVNVTFYVASNSEYYNEYTAILPVTIIDNDQPPTITAPSAGKNIPAGSLMVTGTSAANQQIGVKIDDVYVGTTTTDGAGNWSLLVPKIDAGSHNITAETQANNHYAYLANQYTDAIDVVDVDNRAYIDSISDAFSVGATYNNQDNIVYSASNADGNCRILGYDPLTYEIVADISPEIACSAVSMTISPDGRTAWLLFADGASGNDFAVMEANLSDLTVVSQLPLSALSNLYPSGITISPDGSEFWVRTIDGIQIFNTSDHSHVDSLDFDNPGSAYRHNIVFNQSGTRAYTANSQSGKVYEINTATRTVVNEVTAGEGINMVAFTPDKSQLYVAASYPSSAIYVIDIDSFEVTDSHSVDPDLPPESLAFTEDGQWVVGDDHGTGAIFFGTTSGGATPSNTIYASSGGSYYTSTANFTSPPLTSVLGTSTTTAFSATSLGAPNTGLLRE